MLSYLYSYRIHKAGYSSILFIFIQDIYSWKYVSLFMYMQDI